MDFYEFAKHWLVIGGFGTLVGLSIVGYGYWIYQLVAYIRKKVKTHKDKKAVKQ
jgi:hypothetical protein